MSKIKTSIIKFKNSLIYKTSIVLSLTIIIVLICFGAYQYQRAVAKSHSLLNDTLNLTTERLSFGLVSPLWDFNEEGVRAIIASEMKSNLISGVFITKSEKVEYGFIRDASGKTISSDVLLSGNDHATASGKIVKGQDELGIVHIFISLIPLKQNLKNTLTGLIFQLIVLVVIIISVTIALIRRQIIKPLNSIQESAANIRDGNISIRLESNSKDEIGYLANTFDEMAASLEIKAELAECIALGDLTKKADLASDQDILGISLNKMVKRLNSILGQVRKASNQVSSGSGQVSDSSQSLSHGATEQASALQEITSSITELASQTKNNAENASQANQLSIGARDAAINGNTQMKVMIGAMEEINKSSQEIAKIIKAIDDIAFQTNLLALNAAVEAARAGKHGKGFAVVAQEVRSLAGRSAKAAQETSELIEKAYSKVENGTQIASETAQALNKIVDGATKTADLVEEINSASNEQAQGISQVNLGLTQVEQITMQNTANAEETAAAAEELSAMAVELRKLVGNFKLESEDDSIIASGAKYGEQRTVEIGLLPPAHSLSENE